MDLLKAVLYISDHEQTFQAYSTFTTSYKPPNIYEKLLVSASKSKAQAMKVYERRERNETQLVKYTDFVFFLVSCFSRHCPTSHLKHMIDI